MTPTTSEQEAREAVIGLHKLRETRANSLSDLDRERIDAAITALTRQEAQQEGATDLDAVDDLTILRGVLIAWGGNAPRESKALTNAIAALKAQQEAQGAVGYIDPNADFLLPRKDGCVLSAHFDMLALRDPYGKYTQPIYTTPPAPASVEAQGEVTPIDYAARMARSQAQAAVGDALNVVNEAANDARHRGDYARANALVKARITLFKAATPPAPVDVRRLLLDLDDGIEDMELNGMHDAPGYRTIKAAYKALEAALLDGQPSPVDVSTLR